MNKVNKMLFCRKMVDVDFKTLRIVLCSHIAVLMETWGQYGSSISLGKSDDLIILLFGTGI